jgi:Domain of unknown function (DUF5004)
MIHRIIAVSLSALLLMNCTEEEMPPLATLDEDLLLQEQGWLMVSEIRDNGIAKTDLFMGYASCVRDDVYKFRSDLTYLVEDAMSHCDTLKKEVKATGTWKLSSGILTLRPAESSDQPFTIEQVSTSFNLKKLTESELIYTYLEVETNGTVKSVTTVTMKPVVSTTN